MLHQILNYVTSRVPSEIQKAEAVEYFLYIHVQVCVILGGYIFIQFLFSFTVILVFLYST